MVALILVNQVLANVYILRVHGGDPSFVARHLPAGWFALATDNAVIRWLARGFPAPEVLAPTVLRVQAFLELPFVLLAYGSALRRLDSGLYRKAMGSSLVWWAAGAYTVVFCLIEWELRNQYTVQDIAVRVLAAIVTPPVVIGLARRESGADRQVSAAGLVLFGVSAWALGHLVLVVYDTALLYNLGHLGERLPGAAGAVAAFVVTGLIARRPDAAPPAGAIVTTIAAGLRWSLTLFLIPALAVRYGVNFGTPAVAAAAGLLVVAAAARKAAGDGLSAGPGGSRGAATWALGTGLAGLAGAAAAYPAIRWVNDTYYETALLRGAAVFLVAAVAAATLADRITLRSRGGPLPGGGMPRR